MLGVTDPAGLQQTVKRLLKQAPMQGGERVEDGITFYTVASPLEQSITGVEDMLYMFSQATADGVMTLTITFGLGTDLDKAQVQVQNRVSQALPRLPQDVQRIGVTTEKTSPDLLMVVHLESPDNRYNML